MRDDAPAPPGDVVVAAAGSLRAAFQEIGAEYGLSRGRPPRFRFGASGLLRAAIEAGETADVFASADRAHPERLAAAEGLPVATFATNVLCVIARADLACAPEDLLDLMLDPGIRLGTSTPGADPSGDYAFEAFRRAEDLRPGAAERLRAKSLQLTGSARSAKPAAGSVYAWIMASGRADLFLTYRTNALAAQRERPDLAMVPLPQGLAVGAEYGLVALREPGRDFAATVLSAAGQRILAAHGFGPPPGA